MQIILPPLEIPIDSQFFDQKSEGVVEHGHICSHRFWFKIKTWVDIVKGRIDICAYNIEVSLESLLDRTDEHVEYLRYLDQSPILSSTRTEEGNDDIGLGSPEVEDFGDGKCFHLLRLAQLVTLG